MQYGVDLQRCNPSAWRDVAQAADELGYESVWVAEHLIFPETIEGSPGDHAHITISPLTPLYDPLVMLATLAASTSRIRVGTHVYNIGLRHPFVTARAASTLDIVSGGRFEFGIGVSWLAAEWEAAQLDFSTRGARADEIIAICRRLWAEPVVAHQGRFFDFGPVVFEPKPLQSPLPIHVGGDSAAALRRTVRAAQGWIAMVHNPTTFTRAVDDLRHLADAHARDIATVQRTAIVADPDDVERAAWIAAGATRLIVSPWARTSGAIEGLHRFADQAGVGAH